MKHTLSLLSLYLYLAFHAAPCLATPDSAPALQGWTHLGRERDGSEEPGIEVPGKGIGISSPLIGEVDGDPSNGKEVAAAGADGTVYVYRADGSLLWSATTPNSRCSGGSNRVFSSPAVGDLFGNGVPYVVLGYGGFGTGCTGGVVAYRGSNGAVLWDFNLAKFARRERFKEAYSTVFSTPALADTDGDGRMEIGFGGFDRNVYLLNADGSVRWYYNAADTVFSSPAFVNVDRDPALEMIIGTDISENKKLSPPTSNGGYLYAFKTKALRGKGKRRFFRSKESFVWHTYLDQVLYSSPVVAEVLPESPGPEILIASGCYFPERTRNKSGRWVKVVRASDGVVVQTLEAAVCSSSSVAVGDIDDDGVNEVVATINGASGIGGDGRSQITAWKASSPQPLWSVIPRERGKNDSRGGDWQSPVIADIDGNGSLEVLAANSSSVGVFRGTDGTPLTCQEAECEGQYLLFTPGRLKSTPAVGDVTGDGVLDVVIGGSIGGSGAIFAWSYFEGILESAPGSHPPFSAPWPMFRGDPTRSGRAQ